MLATDVKNPLIVIVGPTAVGKTAFSIDLAEAIDGEIISADSRYFYRYMDIGTAKPSTQEMRSIPHHLIDVVYPDETWNLAVFKKKAEESIQEIYKRKNIPILVGGTGQYVKAVMDAWDLPAQEANEPLRNLLEDIARERGKEYLYQYLKKVDEQAAANIDYSNVRRTIRAIEVILTTGRKFSEQRRTSVSPYSRKIIGLKRDRKELYSRIDQRIDEMIERGFISEVADLLDRGYTRSLPAMSAIGYREIAAYLSGEISLEEALIQMRRMSRQFVRRQANWFKETDPNIKWFDATTLTIEEVVKYIHSKGNWLLPGMRFE